MTRKNGKPDEEDIEDIIQMVLSFHVLTEKIKLADVRRKMENRNWRQVKKTFNRLAEGELALKDLAE